MAGWNEQVGQAFDRATVPLCQATQTACRVATVVVTVFVECGPRPLIGRDADQQRGLRFHHPQQLRNEFVVAGEVFHHIEGGHRVEGLTSASRRC